MFFRINQGDFLVARTVLCLYDKIRNFLNVIPAK
jgi:hypothetical protein